jgi:hypothetical protein
MCRNNRRLSVKWFTSSNTFRTHCHRAFHRILPVLVTHPVHGLIEVDEFFAALEQVALVTATQNSAK